MVAVVPNIDAANIAYNIHLLGGQADSSEVQAGSPALAGRSGAWCRARPVDRRMSARGCWPRNSASGWAARA